MVEAVFKPLRRRTVSFESHNELVLVIYCCITNHPKTSWLQTTTIRWLSFTIFVCQAVIQSTVEMSRLCSLMPGASTGKTEGDSTVRGRLLQDRSMKSATSKPCCEQTLSDKNSKQENHQMYKRRRSYREGHDSDELEQMSPRTWTCSKEWDGIISKVSFNTQFLLSMQLKRQGSFGKRTLSRGLWKFLAVEKLLPNFKTQ